MFQNLPDRAGVDGPVLKRFSIQRVRETVVRKLVSPANQVYPNSPGIAGEEDPINAQLFTLPDAHLKCSGMGICTLPMRVTSFQPHVQRLGSTCHDAIANRSAYFQQLTCFRSYSAEARATDTKQSSQRQLGLFIAFRIKVLGSDLWVRMSPSGMGPNSNEISLVSLLTPPSPDSLITFNNSETGNRVPIGLAVSFALVQPVRTPIQPLRLPGDRSGG